MNIEVLLVLILTSLSCSLIGIFLYLKKMSMMVDALSHTIILGVVFGYFITLSLNYPILLFSGTIVGLFSIYLINFLKNTSKVNEDSAIGIVFPLFFGLAILLISLFAKNIHLDIDMILIGEVIFTSLSRINILGVSIPTAFIWSSICLLINVFFIKLFFKEMKITSFDPLFAVISGFSVIVLEYILIGLASWTVILSADAIGFILVISLMIGPVVTARLLCNTVKEIIWISLLIGICNTFIGYGIAVIADVSISGMISVVTGIVFFIILLFAPEEGIIINELRNKDNLLEIDKNVLLIHLKTHKDTDKYFTEANISNIKTHLNWDNIKLSRILTRLKKDNLVTEDNDILYLTYKGEDKVLQLVKENF